ncbi:Protein of unknown function [Burkholderia sp. OK233]|nr:Protein of unknown function [Burkholderia sp. OK233]
MAVLLPPLDCIRFDEELVCFDAVVNGAPVSCVLTEDALSAASAVDHVISRREAFSLGQSAIRESVARRVKETGLSQIVITGDELAA